MGSGRMNEMLVKDLDMLPILHCGGYVLPPIGSITRGVCPVATRSSLQSPRNVRVKEAG